ncbi:MAG: tRNA (adenosine(37)-N6)-threonylcarbamoyltransferase complex dimerization subunit type 1 TsaB [Acetobacterales bacterium]
MTTTNAAAGAPPRRVLAIDSTTGACSAAVTVDGRLAGRWRREGAQGHAEVLMPGIAEAMAAAGAGFADLDLLAVTVGPGSFTGLRVGLAAVRGLALALGVPVVGVSTFEAVAAGASDVAARSRCILVDSRRGDVFLQCFGPAGHLSGPLAEPVVAAPESVPDLLPPGPLWIGGDGVAVLRAAGIDPAARGDAVLSDAGPDAVAVAAVGVARHLGMLPPLPMRPLYIRPPAAKLPAAR